MSCPPTKSLTKVLPHDFFVSFDRQVQNYNIPVFCYGGEPLFDNERDLPELPEDSERNEFEQKSKQHWKLL